MVRWMCGVSLKDRKRRVDLYSLLGVQSVADVARRGRLRCFGHLEPIRVWMIGYRPAERWRWQGRDVRGGKGRLGKSVWMMTCKCFVYILNGRYSGMCGGTSYGQTSNPSVAWKKWTF